MKRRKFLQTASMVTAAATAWPLKNIAMQVQPQPSVAQQAWMNLKYGMFLHFGPNTVQGVGWGDGKFKASEFNPGLNADQWADVAYRAGMKYAVLTARHLDGFSLWHTRHTDYSVKNAPQNTDVVKAFTEAFRKRGLKVGLYYSLWDRYQPFYTDDARYAQFMRDQVTELLTNYGEIVELWFDGSWDKDHPTKEWNYNPDWEKDPNSGLLFGTRYEWEKLYQTIKSIQPNCLVINNSSSDRPGGVKYMPIDIRTAEHFNFVNQGKLCPPVIDPIYKDKNGQQHFLPLEYCTSLNPDWFQTNVKYYNHPSVDQIVGWYKTARSHNANLLLNVGPDKQGVIPQLHIDFLLEAAKQIRS